MAPAAIRCCIFDLVGTLVDVRPAVLEATFAALEQWAPGKFSREDLAEQFSGPLEDPFVAAAEGREPVANELRRVFLEHWESRRHESIVPFPGVPEMLAALVDLGTTVVVLSGSTRAAGSKDMEASGLASFVSAVVFQDDIERPKPFADAATRALEVSGASAQEALLIGESDTDIQCGRLAGVSTGAALWGAVDQEALLGEKPDFAFAQPSEVGDVVRKSED